MKLIPQFTLRWLLAITAACAVAFSVVALALRGYTWAGGVSIGLLALVVLATVYAGMFSLVWAASAVMAVLSTERPPRSPFRPSPFAPARADGEPPPPTILE